jgi:hypothetical protein
MKSLTVAVLLIGLPLALPFDFFAASGEQSATLAVAMIDHSRTPPLELFEAQRLSSGVLARAGVKSTWKLCSPASEKAGPDQVPCLPAGPLTIFVRILSSAAARDLPMNRHSCGLALTGQLESEFGMLTMVDAGCVAGRSAGRSGAFSRVLGHVVAHEIGHLLLGRNSHSNTGLMASRWTIVEQHLLMRGQLGFNRNELPLLQKALRRRSLAVPHPNEIARQNTPNARFPTAHP